MENNPPAVSAPYQAGISDKAGLSKKLFSSCFF
jgi:hypothetical protein